MDFDQDFFASFGMRYNHVNGQKYASLNQILNWSDLGFNFSLAELGKISIDLAEVLNLAIKDIFKKPEILGKMGYGYRFKNLTQNYILSKDYLPPFAMRLGYIVDENGDPHLIEVNSQTPTFWWECEEGNKLILEKNRVKKRSLNYSDKNLEICLKNSLQNLAKSLKKDVKNLNIGLVCGEDDEDIFQMSFIKNKIESLNLVKDAEVLTVNRLDADEDDNFYSLNSGNIFDVLFLWYPYEWLVDEEFENGKPVWNILLKALENKRVVLWNGVESFLMQNKYVLSYITENWEKFGNKNIFNPFTDTFYTHDELTKIYGKNAPWIAKPIWGRQGLGVMGFDGQENFAGKMDEDYVNQWYAYQPFYKSKTFKFENKTYNFTLESWVYFDGEKYMPGGVGIRANSGLITEDYSKWFALFHD